MNFEALMKLSSAWNTFRGNHPKFPDFLHAVKNKGLVPGMEVDICITYPNEGGNVKTHLCIRPEDLALLETLNDLS